MCGASSSTRAIDEKKKCSVITAGHSSLAKTQAEIVVNNWGNVSLRFCLQVRGGDTSFQNGPISFGIELFSDVRYEQDARQVSEYVVPPGLASRIARARKPITTLCGSERVASLSWRRQMRKRELNMCTNLFFTARNKINATGRRDAQTLCFLFRTPCTARIHPTPTFSVAVLRRIWQICTNAAVNRAHVHRHGPAPPSMRMISARSVAFIASVGVEERHRAGNILLGNMELVGLKEDKTCLKNPTPYVVKGRTNVKSALLSQWQR